MKVRLKPYQREGVAWLLDHPRALLADDPGLGKTAQVIRAIVELRKKAIVLCPASLIDQWCHEVERFSTLKVRTGLDICGKWDIYIISYDRALRHADWLRTIKAKIMVLDEAQRIKNPHAKTSMALKELGNYDYKWVVTGTPLENRIEDIQSLLEFLDCERDLSKLDSKSLGLVLGASYGPEVAALAGSEAFGRIKGLNKRRITHDTNLMTVQDTLGGLMLRRFKEDHIPDLPDKVEKTYCVALDPEARKAYTTWASRLRGGLDDPEWTFTNALDVLQKLRQICLDPSLVGEKGASPKLDELVEIIKDANAGGQKVVVFTEYRRALARVGERLKREGIDYVCLHGGTKHHEREKAQLAAGANVMLCTRTGELGHNLQAANVVVNYDLPYNPARLEQRVARCHRRGQEKQVRVINIVVPNTIEDRIQKILATKRALFEALINEPARRQSWRKWMKELV